MNEFLIGFGLFVGYYVVAVLLLASFKVLLKPPKELFRKLLHMVCATSVLLPLYTIDKWYLAMLVPLAFAIILYPLFIFLERYPKLMELLVQRKSGEIRSSLIIVFLMMAILIAMFWGLLGEKWKYIIIVSVMAWGFGDAAAALVGKAFGRKPNRHRWVEGTKTREGTVAMYCVSATSILLCLLIYTALPWYICLLGALVTAPICALVELVSHKGLDTITVPFATAIPIFSLMILFSYMGV